MGPTKSLGMSTSHQKLTKSTVEWRARFYPIQWLYMVIPGSMIFCPTQRPCKMDIPNWKKITKGTVKLIFHSVIIYQ